MRYDFSPLYRSTVGFDRLFDLLDQTSVEPTNNWPPYNIDKIGDDEFRITMAVAGFSTGRNSACSAREYASDFGSRRPARPIVSRRCIGVSQRDPSGRPSTWRTTSKVESAKLENGLLVIGLKREVPEALKPRRIEISAGDGPDCPGRTTSARSVTPKRLNLPLLPAI